MKGDYFMKLRLLSLTLAAMLTATPAYTITGWAQTYPATAPISNICPNGISPRYKYIQGIHLYVDPSNSQVEYGLSVNGSAEVTSISGQLIIYKKNSSGNYEQIFSKKLSSTGRTLNVSDTIPSKGAGTYKITFSGTAYTNTGFEVISSEMEDSY